MAVKTKVQAFSLPDDISSKLDSMSKKSGDKSRIVVEGLKLYFDKVQDEVLTEYYKETAKEHAEMVKITEGLGKEAFKDRQER